MYVFGLSTGLRGPLMGQLWLWSLLLGLLLGDGLALALLNFLLTLGACLRLTATAST